MKLIKFALQNMQIKRGWVRTDPFIPGAITRTYEHAEGFKAREIFHMNKSLGLLVTDHEGGVIGRVNGEGDLP